MVRNRVFRVFVTFLAVVLLLVGSAWLGYERGYYYGYSYPEFLKTQPSVLEARTYDVGNLINAADDLDQQLFFIGVAIQIGTDAGRWTDLGGTYVIQRQPNTTSFVVETDGHVHETIEQILTDIELAGVDAKND